MLKNLLKLPYVVSVLGEIRAPPQGVDMRVRVQIASAKSHVLIHGS